MKIFIDSADLTEIKKYLSWGLCDGVTMNPTICLKDGVRGGIAGIKERTMEVARLVAPGIVSAEVTSDRHDDILSQARAYNSWAENIAVKVTITDREGHSLLPAIHQLVREGIRINVTAMTTFTQAILAAKVLKDGIKRSSKPRIPHFISIFAGRISEEHGVEHARAVLRATREWLDFHHYEGVELLVGSVRSPENVEFWGNSGAHILTVRPEVLQHCLLAARTKETVVRFLNDAEKAMGDLGSIS